MKAVTKITFPNGLIFDVPTKIIADNRTMHYTLVDTSLTKAQHEAETVALFTSSEFEVVDWLKNNMDWKDVDNFAVLTGYEAPDLNGAWNEATAELSEKSSGFNPETIASANTLMPVEALLQATAAAHKRVTILALNDGDGNLKAFVAAFIAETEVLHGFMATLEQFDAHIESTLKPPAAAQH